MSTSECPPLWALWVMLGCGLIIGFSVARGPAEWTKAIQSVRRAIAAWRAIR